MTTTKLSLAIMIALTAACAAPRAHVTPTQRTAALHLFVNGATTDEIAAQLQLPPDDARAAVRGSLRSLVRRYHQER
jgi:hypothetical protein